MWLICVFGVVLVLWGVWGVSIIREWGNGKANPLRKSKKNLTRELKKTILAIGGVKKFYEKGKKNFFINFS